MKNKVLAVLLSGALLFSAESVNVTANAAVVDIEDSAAARLLWVFRCHLEIRQYSCGVVPNTEQIILRLNCSTYFPTVPKD